MNRMNNGHNPGLVLHPLLYIYIFIEGSGMFLTIATFIHEQATTQKLLQKHKQLRGVTLTVYNGHVVVATDHVFLSVVLLLYFSFC